MRNNQPVSPTTADFQDAPSYIIPSDYLIPANAMIITDSQDLQTPSTEAAGAQQRRALAAMKRQRDLDATIRREWISVPIDHVHPQLTSEPDD